MTQMEQTWLAADYHFPFTYSCRSPMSSPYSGRALPTPGSVTIKLALVHTAVELFGVRATQAELFLPIMTATILTKPPTSVAISTQLLHGYKANDAGHLHQSLLYREFACTQDYMTIFLSVPLSLSDTFTQLVRAIGYWGQANSFASCVSVQQRTPESNSYAQPLEQLTHLHAVRHYFSAFVSEFCSDTITWSDIMDISSWGIRGVISPRLYVWPLIVSEQRSMYRLLRYHLLE